MKTPAPHISAAAAAAARITSSALLFSLLYVPLPGGLTGMVAMAQTTQTTISRFEYDAEGNLKKVTDPLARATYVGYDFLNRISMIQQPTPTPRHARQVISYHYDARDEPWIVTDPRALRTIYNTDGFGNRITTLSPDTGTTTDTINLTLNAVATRKDARGQVTAYTYDANGRVTRMQFGSGAPTTFEYDGGPGGAQSAKGRVTKMTDESGSTVYGYDAFGELATKSQTVTAGGVSHAHTLSYAYAANGRLNSMTYPSGSRINYSYDAAGRVSAVSVNPPNANGAGTNSAVMINILSGIGYAAHGPVLGWSWGNSTAASPNGYARTYDLDGRTTSYNLGNPATSGALRTLSYDAASRISGYTHTSTNPAHNAAALNQTFGYDDLDRLTRFTAAATSQTYNYDASGNRTQATFGVNSYTNTIDPASNKLMGTTGPLPVKTNRYDPAGNLLSDGTVTYTYSARGRMSSATVGTTTTSYLFNGAGQRVRQLSSAEQSNSAGLYVYDERGQLAGEYDTASGKATREVIYLGDIPVAMLRHGVTDGAPAPGSGTSVFYLYPDHINTPRVITRAIDGKIVWRWDSADPFGMSPPSENPDGSEIFTLNLRMPGQYYDQQTNLSYNYYRDYDPQTGRYIQSDPIGLGSGINTYGYVGGNPVWAYDKFGLAKVKPRNRMSSSHPRIAEVEERLAFVRMYLHVRATNCPGEGSELLDLFNTWTVYVDSEKGSSDPQDGETVADTFGDRRVTILYINAEITTQLLAHELFHLTAANMRTKSANGNRETFSLVPHDKRSWEIPAIDFGNKFLDCKCSR